MNTFPPHEPPLRPSLPMTYQTRLFLAFAAGFVAFALVCFAGFLLTAAMQQPKFPDIIAEQPNLRP